MSDHIEVEEDALDEVVFVDHDGERLMGVKIGVFRGDCFFKELITYN